MQRFTVKFLLICSFLLLGGQFCLAQNPDSDAATSLESGNKAFEAGQFTAAMKDYENVYAQGHFSEIMLYRLAFMHENLRAYPQAIYYLKKAAQEYGERDTDAKIRQLMQRQGSTKFFLGDPWNSYLTVFRAWGWIVYLCFGLAILALAAHYLLPNANKPSWRQLSMVAAWGLLVVSGFMLFHRSFMVPQRAVLLEATAFYSEPGFSANHHLNAFGLGETLDISDASDIWIHVSAGGQGWWVPNWVVREL